MQANAEPDFRQTGQRLQGVVKGLIEGVVKIVADPLAEQLVRPANLPPGLSSELIVYCRRLLQSRMKFGFRMRFRSATINDLG